MTQTAGNSLTREKIQQLLRAIGSQDCDRSENSEAVDYDWHQPHYFNDEQIAKLNRFTTRAAASIASKFGTLCQGNFEVTIDSTTQHFAAHFLNQRADTQNQQMGNYYLAFGKDEQPACGFVSIPPQTAIMWTTQLLGETEPDKDEDRTLTKLEESLLLDVAFLIVESLIEADNRCGFAPATSTLTNHLPLDLKGTEEFCKISFSVKRPDSESKSEAHILVLCDNLAPVVDENAQPDRQPTRSDISAAILRHLEKTPVSVTAKMATVWLTLEQIIGMSAGDIVLLGKKVNEPVKLLVEGRNLFRARPAKSGGNYAVVIEEPISGEPQNADAIQDS